MFPTFRDRALPRLYDLALQTVIQNNPLGGRIPPFPPIPDEVDFALSRWQDLKENAPLGPLDTTKIMRAVEEEFHVSKPLNFRTGEGIPVLTYQQNFPRNFRVNLLFHEFQRKLESESGIALGKWLPVTHAELAHVQRVIHTIEENRALREMWDALIFHELIEVEEPVPTTIQDIRTWLTHPDNAEQIELIDELDLSQKNLKVLPWEIGLFRGLQSLDLSDNHFRYLPKSLGNLTGLSILRLNNNHLVMLPKSLSSLTALTEIYLDGNELAELPESLTSLTSLTALRCNSNRLIKLSDNFANLTSLRTLTLDNNRLTELPETFCNLTALRKLNLQRNYLITLPQSFNNLKALESLSLSSNYFTIFPASLSELTTLNKLNLSDNTITILPESISQLTALRELNLADNHLEQLPESCGGMIALQLLELQNNNIRHLPESLSTLRLLWLELQNNYLEQLPESFSKLLSLNSLKVANNLLVRLPDSFRAMFSARPIPFGFHFELQGNPLLYISDQALRDLYSQSQHILTSLIHFEDEAINYSCQSTHAKLIHALICRDRDAARAFFEKMPQEFKQQIESRIAPVAPPLHLPSSSSSNTGSFDLFADLDALGRVLRTEFLIQFDQLDKTAVYLQYSKLAGHGEDEQWGKEHFSDHILRSIDALDIVISRKRKAENGSSEEPVAKKQKSNGTR